MQSRSIEVGDCKNLVHSSSGHEGWFHKVPDECSINVVDDQKLLSSIYSIIIIPSQDPDSPHTDGRKFRNNMESSMYSKHHTVFDPKQQ